MANYADAALDAAKYKVPELMNSAEMRIKPSSGLMKYLGNRDFLIPATERERVLRTKSSDQQTVEINTLNKQTHTVKTAREAAHTGSKSDSRKQTVSFATYGADFSYSLKSAGRNIWELEDLLAAQMQSAFIAIMEDIESDVIARLDANRSQVSISSPLGGSWDGVNFWFTVANADTDFWMQRVSGFMRQNKYTGMFDAITDDLTYQQAEKIANQGGGNSTNLAFQVGNLSILPTIEPTVPASSDGVGYVFPQGTVGCIDWIPVENREGYGSSGEVGGLYTSIQDPYGLGLTFALHQYQQAADSNSADGETQDVVYQVELSIDLAFVEADTSTANESSIFKFRIAS